MIQNPFNNSGEATVTSDEVGERDPEISFYQKSNGYLSPVELDLFDTEIRKKDAYRNGDFSTLRSNRDVPMEIIFFGDDPHDPYKGHFELTEDHERHAIAMRCITGDETLITPFLNEYGFTQLSKEYVSTRKSEIIRLMNNPDVIDFIRNEEIKDEDTPLLEAALELPVTIYIENQNNFSRLDSYTTEMARHIDYLKKRIAESSEPSEHEALQLKYDELMYQISNKYNPTIALRLNTLMKRVKSKKTSGQ